MAYIVIDVTSSRFTPSYCNLYFNGSTTPTYTISDFTISQSRSLQCPNVDVTTLESSNFTLSVEIDQFLTGTITNNNGTLTFDNHFRNVSFNYGSFYIS